MPYVLNKDFLKFLVSIVVIPPFFLISFFRRRKTKKNLIVYLEALGDTIIFSGTISKYREVFSKRGEKVIFLFNKDVVNKNLLGEDHLFVSKSTLWRNPYYFLKFISKNFWEYDSIINASSNQGVLISDIIALCLGTRYTYRSFGEYFLEDFYRKEFFLYKSINFIRFFYRKVLYPDNVFSLKDGKICHVFLYHQYLLNYFSENNKQYNLNELIPKLSIREGFDLPQNTLEDLKNQKFCLLVPDAGDPYRSWPIDSFLQISKFIVNKGVKVVVVGSQKNNFLISHLGKSNDIINLFGKTSLKDFFWLVANAAFVISNESSAVHLAIAFKVPSVCILGGGHFGRCSLYGYEDFNFWIYSNDPGCFCDNWNCSLKNPGVRTAPCIESIDVKSVLKTVEYVIHNLRGRSTHTGSRFYIESK